MAGTICEFFVETLLHYRDDGAFGVHAFVLMPDHMHVLVTPAQDKTIERVVQLIKGGSAHRIGKERLLRFPVWQRGFSDHRIRDVADYENHVRYIEMNAVRKGLVASPGEYAWSSASGRYRMDERPQGLKPQRDGAIRHG